MSKTGKIIAIIGGSAAVLLVGLLAIGFYIYWVTGDAEFKKSRAEGADFGKTKDYDGCQKEGISRVRQMGLFEVTESVKVQYFVAGCLETSRPSPDFCKNVPTESQDIWDDNKWKDEQCRKLGWKEMSPNCRTVLRARLDFCEKR